MWFDKKFCLTSMRPHLQIWITIVYKFELDFLKPKCLNWWMCVLKFRTLFFSENMNYELVRNFAYSKRCSMLFRMVLVNFKKKKKLNSDQLLLVFKFDRTEQTVTELAIWTLIFKFVQTIFCGLELNNIK